jgi:hypothetical protein
MTDQWMRFLRSLFSRCGRKPSLTVTKPRWTNRWQLILVGGVVAVLSHGAFAGQQMGDWTLAMYADGSGEAYTSNSSGSLFGLYCATKCFFYLRERRDCIEGDFYPVLINFQGGADYLQMVCAKLAGLHFPVYVLNDVDKLITATSRSRQIGFAMPLEDGEFAVSRFSLNGSNRAISSLLHSTHYGKPNSKSSYGDSVM